MLFNGRFRQMRPRNRTTATGERIVREQESDFENRMPGVPKRGRGKNK